MKGFIPGMPGMPGIPGIPRIDCIMLIAMRMFSGVITVLSISGLLSMNCSSGWDCAICAIIGLFIIACSICGLDIIYQS